MHIFQTQLKCWQNNCTGLNCLREEEMKWVTDGSRFGLTNVNLESWQVRGVWGTGQRLQNPRESVGGHSDAGGGEVGILDDSRDTQHKTMPWNRGPLPYASARLWAKCIQTVHWRNGINFVGKVFEWDQGVYLWCPRARTSPSQYLGVPQPNSWTLNYTA